MKMRLIFFFSFLVTTSVSAQTDSLQQQINQQVWKPFIKSFNDRDDAGFAAVHSKEVTRVIQDDNRIQGFDQYFQKVPDSIRARWSKWNRKIELRFVQRIASNGRAFEVGFYKTHQCEHADGRKEDVLWKISRSAAEGKWSLENPDGRRCCRKNR
jgi:hypothetical protein